MIKKLMVVCLLLLLVPLIGCAKNVEEKPTDTEISADSIGKGISDVGALDSDLSTSDLNNLDSDLDNINW